MKGRRPKSVGQWWPTGEAVTADDILRKDVARAVLGMTRMGKSTWLKNTVLPCLMEARRDVVVFDIHDEYSVEGVERETTPLGPLTHRVEAPDFEDWLRENHDTVFNRRGLALAIVPRPTGDKPRAEIAAQIEEALPWLRARGDCDVMFAELAGWGKHARESITEVITGWLKDGIRPWLEAQGYRFLDIEWRSQVSEVYSFGQVDSADVRFLAQDCGRGFALEVATLEPHNFRARNRRVPDPALLAELAGMQPPTNKEK